MIKKQLNSVLIKPSGPDCNLGCTYCFYLEKAGLYHQQKVHRMDEETLEMLIRQVMEQSGPEVSFGWQGGEPTLMGLDFFRKVIELQQKYGNGKTVGNGLQTNGLLLNEEWAEFLKEYNWLVGLSLDGPQHIHDHYRLTPNGKPSWEIVSKNAKMLLDKGVATNVLSCLTDHSADHIEEIYNYHKEMGFDFMQFIPIVETDKENPRAAASFSLSPEKYGEVLCKLWDLWINDFQNGIPTTSVRHFDSLFHTYVGIPAPECTLQKECGVYTVIEHNGDVYACDFFVEPQWKLGNIKQGKIINMLNSKKQHQFGCMKAKLPRKCKSCSYLKHCFGGCTKDRIKDPMDNGMPRFCTSYKMFFAHAHTQLQEMGRNWIAQQMQMQREMEAQQSGGTYNAFNDFVKKS
ncbi:anaerobic sulfatase maturase [Marinifilum sp. D737]|uniref:anaerobic sulfatase maturase n=1 Tax=Marinifilum sp. D737 TaxID=2969628 RepID=UPI0022730551|nr:anaerobic sulfatase maturase [Marinifilum sp. D737]MCY1633501.1 anaerobic sulfatase maturase [Marinifilum sp. D737]